LLNVFVELFDKHLSQAGVITNLLLKSEHSVFEDDEKQEVELYFAAKGEGWDEPIAVIHFYPLPDEQLCEIEMEVEFKQEEGKYLEADVLWKQAQSIVEDISFTEKRRFITPNRLVEVAFVMDFHLIVAVPQSEEETTALDQQIAQIAQKLGALVRL